MTDCAIRVHIQGMRSSLLLPILMLCAACGKSYRSQVVLPPQAPEAVAKTPLVFPASFVHPDIGTVPLDQRKRILIYSDDGEHGWMQHENTAGAVLLAKRLAKAVPACEVTVWRDVFPDAAALDQAASVVLFCSGTDRHPLNKAENLAALEKAMQAGKGLVVLHWGLEAGTPEGSAFLKTYLGGCFEVDHSVNPMWLAEFKSIPEHPATCGVEPFSIYDEFYFNMRFPEVAGTRTTLLEAVPPKKVILLPPDGPRTNNPVVRGSLGKPHVTAWAYGRPGGGRSVGYTGGHFHPGTGNKTISVV